ncbi:MAG: hypothetical protein ACTSY1_05885 [Alphaproteobacteria bacterium]
MTSNRRTLYRNTRRTLRVRIVAWCLIGAGLAGLVAVQDIYATYGLSPGDGGVLKPWSERLAFAATLGALCLAVIASAIALSARYVAMIVETRAGSGEKLKILEITTAGLFGPQMRTVPQKGSIWRRHSGAINTAYTQAPYLALRPAKTMIPYIVDLQAEQVSLPKPRNN